MVIALLWTLMDSSYCGKIYLILYFVLKQEKSEIFNEVQYNIIC